MGSNTRVSGAQSFQMRTKFFASTVGLNVQLLQMKLINIKHSGINHFTLYCLSTHHI